MTSITSFNRHSSVVLGPFAIILLVRILSPKLRHPPGSCTSKCFKALVLPSYPPHTHPQQPIFASQSSSSLSWCPSPLLRQSLSNGSWVPSNPVLAVLLDTDTAEQVACFFPSLPSPSLKSLLLGSCGKALKKYLSAWCSVFSLGAL